MTTGRDAEERGRWAWLGASAVALIAAGWWLRAPSAVVLALTFAAALVMLALGARLAAGRRRAALSGLLVVIGVIVALPGQRTLRAMRADWYAYARGVEKAGVDQLAADVRDAVAQARRTAEAALDAQAPETGPVRLAPVPAADGDLGVVRYAHDSVLAWAGTMRVRPDSMRDSVGTVFTSYYLVAYASAVRGTDRAVATVLVHAEPPADQLASAIDEGVATRIGIGRFLYSTLSTGPRFTPVSAGGRVLFSVAAEAPTPLTAEVTVLEAARRRVGPLLALALLAMVAAAWGRGATLSMRLVALWVVLAVVAAAPLNAYSNVSRIFDPAVYFAGFGGPFTATLAGLAITSAVTLLALLALQRSPGRVLSRRQAVVGVLVIAVLGPLLLRDLAAGIVVPSDGASFALWGAWQGALFLAAMAIVVAGIAAGRDALAARRGLAPWIAPVIAGAAAVAAPMLWHAPEGWPDWYTATWAIAILALALTRRSPWFIVSCALVAGPGAVTLVWGASSRARMELARADVQRLYKPDRDVTPLVNRFIEAERRLGPARNRAEMLSRYARSELSAAGVLVHLGSWRADGAPISLLDLAPFPDDPAEVQALATEARRTHSVRVARAGTTPWLQLNFAVPHAGGEVSTIVVAPRSRLLPDDPFAVFLGLASSVVSQPPYALSIAGGGPPGARVVDRERWQRRGSELHGDWEVNGVNGPLRLHASVELRPMETLVPRGALLVLADVVLVGLLWVANVAAGGALGRWLRIRREAFTGSFRARITGGLFVFALLPVLAFATVAVRRLQADDRRSRELVVLETLRGAVSAQGEELPKLADRLGVPLFLYADGVLTATSEALHSVLAPTGRFLDPALLAAGSDEVAPTTREEHVGAQRALVGYRTVDVQGGAARYVLAAPARTDVIDLDRQRNDLLILLVFAASAAALAAFWLSGVVARQLASPIEVLRRNALAVAAGASPELPRTPVSEFVPVFRAFRRMTDDLGESRHALEEAQRRTAAVLLHVASGVVAVTEAGEVVLANPRAEAILGTTLVPGRPLEGAVGSALAAAARRFASEADVEREFDLPAGARRLHARLTRLPSGRGLVITLDDLTELARAQRVLAWGEMARQVAHEIKNPLTPIRLGVQHLQRARHDARVDFDEVLDRNAGRILAEIDRLDEIARTFSRFGTTPLGRPAREGVELGELLRDVVALEGLDTDQAVAWSVEAPDDLPRVLAREDEFREVLLNLLENARLAGARQVRVAARADGERAVVTVTDDGEGIPADALPRVFEPHFSTRTSGSGLGLAICKRLVEGWGGAIALESVVGKGTTVTLTLAGAVRGGEIPVT
ncbi:MAG: ATP-binding protein [Gemmatimonadetes bacterium]|nr:ATP-binding protein [Gemmatimonadota bacterium]